MLRIAYVSNGLAEHRLEDALALLADCGYAGVAITLSHAHLDPSHPDLLQHVAHVGRLLERSGLSVVVETGGRFLLDPRRKHQPTLMSDEGRERRLDLLLRAVAIAGDLGAEVVSLWSGAAPAGQTRQVAWQRLVDGCSRLVEAAAQRGVRLGFEPEPDMLVDTLDRWDELASALGHPPTFAVTLDLGHCQCLEPESVPACIERVAGSLVHVHIEDMRRGVHEHLDFGQGEIDFPSALAALERIGYPGLVAVELPRHSHEAHLLVPRAIRFLRGAALQVVDA